MRRVRRTLGGFGALAVAGAAITAPAPVVADPADWSAISDMRPGAGSAPQMSLMDDGSLIAAWGSQGEEPLTSGVSVARRSSAAAWSTPAFLRGSMNLSGPFMLASSDSGQRSVVVFTALDAPQVWVAASTDFGVTWSTPALINESLSFGSGDILGSPQVAVSPDGLDVAVTWSYTDDGGSAVFYAGSDDGGTTWSEVREIASGTGEEPVGLPSVDVTSAGAVVMGWLVQESSHPVMKTRMAASTTTATWSAPVLAVDVTAPDTLLWGSTRFSPDGSHAVIVYGTRGAGRDIGVRVGTVSGTSITWSPHRSATGGVEDVSFPEPALDISDDATFELGNVHTSADASRVVVTFEVMAHGQGSASRAGVVISLDSGATWGAPVWLSSGRSFVDTVRSAASANGQRIDVLFTSEVFDPITCEEGQEECVPGDGPPNGASVAEEGTWIASSIDGGATWGSATRISTELLHGAAISMSSSGTRAAVTWSGSGYALRWVVRGINLTPTTPPSAPRDVSITRKAGELQVSWQAPTSPGSSAVIRYRATASPGGRTCLATPPSRTCTIAQLQPGTTYTVSVSARNATHDGWSASGRSAQVTVGGEPSKVRQIKVTPAGRGKVTLSWTAPSSTGGIPLTGYRLSYRAAGDSTPIVRDGLPVSPRSLSISGLAAGRKYTFTVVARNSVTGSQPAASEPYKVPK